MPDIQLTIPKPVADLVVAFFRPLADAPASTTSFGDPTFDSFSRHMDAARREDAARLVAAFAGDGPSYACDPGLVRRAIRELVDAGLSLRAAAYGAHPDPESVPGGFITRMFANDLSPEADDLDRVAIALANAIPGIDTAERLGLCI